jgi:hypothetical protein
MVTAIFMVILFIFSQPVWPCEIDIKILNDQPVKKGDVIVIQVKVALTHRVCELGPEDTKFKTEGLEIVAATKWKETEPGKIERKLKVKVLKSGEVQLDVIRDCRKEGGRNSLKFTVVEGNDEAGRSQSR